MEYLDIYDDQGIKTGRKIIRGDKSVQLSKNEHIAISVIFIENEKNEFLIQKTSKEKGGEYSSTGGHVDSGETPLEAILREVKEELGITLKKEEIKEYGYLLFDMPLRYLFYCKKNISIKEITIQEEEVESIEYMTVSQIEKLIKENKMLKSHAILFQELLKKQKKM